MEAGALGNLMENGVILYGVMVKSIWPELWRNGGVNSVDPLDRRPILGIYLRLGTTAGVLHYC